MITPQQKIQIMRMYAVDPSSAIVALSDMLSVDIEKRVTMNLKNELMGLEKIVQAMSGTDGDDAEPEEVASQLFAMPEFIAMTKGEPGKSVSVKDVVAVLKDDRSFIDAVSGDDGDDASPQDVAAVLMNNKRFLEAIKGKDANPQEVADILKNDTKFIQAIEAEPGEPGEDGSPDTPDEIAEKLNMTQESVEMNVIKGLDTWMTGIRTSIRQLGVSKREKGGGKVGGGGNILEYYDLTSQCDGVTKTFTIPKCRRVLSVHSTEFPGVYRPAVDWSSTQTSITLTSEVSAPASGQTLYIIYIH